MDKIGHCETHKDSTSAATPDLSAKVSPNRAARGPGRRSFLAKASALWGANALGLLSSRGLARPQNTKGSDHRIDPAKHRIRPVTRTYDALVIGSGFGGAVTALRLSQVYGSGVLIIERGKRYPPGSFARTLPGFMDSFWRQKGERVPRPFPLPGVSNGVFDLRSYPGMDTLVAAGFGGGSLIYAAAIVEPNDPEFDLTWPSSMKKAQLAPYFKVFKQVVGARSVPQGEPGRRVERHELFRKAAEELGGTFANTDVAIHFGPDKGSLPPMGTATLNAHGAHQTTCQYCAECIVGCNVHAKNSLDLNYLYAAEHKYGAEVKTEYQAEKIIPLDADGLEDKSADGSHGFHVYLKPLDNKTQDTDYELVKTNKIVVAAGVYGTTELLLRNQELHDSLPRISSRLGHGFSGNGDFINLVFGAKGQNISHFGPTITSNTRLPRTENSQAQTGFLVEDMAYPDASNWVRWISQLCKPQTRRGRLSTSPLYERILEATQDPSSDSTPMTLLLGMGLDQNNGHMTLSADGSLQLTWRPRSSKTLYDRLMDYARAAKKVWGGKVAAPFPTYILGRNFTVHPLGGCALAESEDQGVVDCSPQNFGAVFGYRNLYVADGSIVPSALGVNPSLTIGALAEMVAEGITGVTPTADF